MITENFFDDYSQRGIVLGRKIAELSREDLIATIEVLQSVLWASHRLEREARESELQSLNRSLHYVNWMQSGCVQHPNGCS